MQSALIAALVQSPLALIFLVIALGALVSKWHIRGVGLGIAAVLFAGLALGAWGGPGFEPPALLGQFGLLIFVYAIGLEAGPPFFKMARRRGWALGALAVVSVALVALPAWIGVRWFGLSPGLAVGLFCGATTNTPALAAIDDMLAGTAASALPVIGYAMAYPLGVLLPLLVAEAALRIRRVDLAGEVRKAERDAGLASEPPVAMNLVIASAAAAGRRMGSGPLADLPLLVSRVRHDGHVAVPLADTRLERGDVIHVVGTQQAVDDALRLVGPEEPGSDGPEESRAEVDFRRIILSRRALTGHHANDLGFDPAWGAVVTRVRRGDLDFVPTPATRLELGDRLRVVARTEHMPAISRHLGDSFRVLGELDLLPLALGLTLGLAVGAIRVALPGGITLQLGTAGGPLVVALALGWLGRTGPLNWRLPQASALAMRQLGLVIFFACVGLRAGHQFAAALSGQALTLVALGALATLLSTAALLAGAVALLRVDWVSALGILAGGQTQPAVLAYAEERCHGEAPDVGYASIFPIATLAKILGAQVLLAVLS